MATILPSRTMTVRRGKTVSRDIGTTDTSTKTVAGAASQGARTTRLASTAIAIDDAIRALPAICIAPCPDTCGLGGSTLRTAASVALRP
jgi:hypothetical protein